MRSALLKSLMKTYEENKSKNLLASVRRASEQPRKRVAQAPPDMPSEGEVISAYDWANHMTDKFVIVKEWDVSLDHLKGTVLDTIPAATMKIADTESVLKLGAANAVKRLLAESKNRKRNVKASMGINYYCCKLEAPHEFSLHVIQTPLVELLTTTAGVEDWYKEAISKINTHISEKNLAEAGTGWVFIGIRDVFIRYYAYDPLRGGAWQPVPEWVNAGCKGGRTAVSLSMKDVPTSWEGSDKHDDRCFEHALMASQFYDKVYANVGDRKKHQRLDIYYGTAQQHKDWRKGEDYVAALRQTFNLDGIDFPTPVGQMKRFEQQNPGWGISLVYIGEESKEYHLLHRAPLDVPKEKIIWIGLLGSDNDPCQSFSEGHYVWLRRPSSLAYNADRRDNRTVFPCRTCLRGKPEDDLKAHEDLCCEHKHFQPDMPKVNEKTGEAPFVRAGMGKGEELALPYWGTYDLEAFTSADDAFMLDGRQQSGKAQETSCITWSFFDKDNKLVKLGRETYDGTETLKEFRHRCFDKMRADGDELLLKWRIDEKNFPYPGDLTEEEQQQHDSAKCCCKCGGKFSKTNRLFFKVRHHDHAVGDYGGAMHAICNLNHTLQGIIYIPMFAHNFTGYDSKPLILTISEKSYEDFDENANGCMVEKEKLPAGVRGGAKRKPAKKKAKEDAVMMTVDDGALAEGAEEAPKKKKIPRGPTVLARTSEKIIMIRWQAMQFKDSMTFIGSSLDKAVEAQREPDKITDMPTKTVAEAFPGTYSYYYDKFKRMGYSEARIADAIELICKKGDCPHGYMTGVEVLRQTEFFSRDAWGKQAAASEWVEGDDERRVKQKKEPDYVISEKQYNTQKAAWDVLQCRHIGQWYEEYCMRDTLLLGDLLAARRERIMKPKEEGGHGLDLCKYVSMPSLGYAALYSGLKQRIHLVEDYDHYMKYERVKRGGLCFIRRRYAKGNNKYMGRLHDESKRSSYICYMDMNSLYPSAMVYPQPTTDHVQISEEEEKDEVMAAIVRGLSQYNPVGYIPFISGYFPKDTHAKLQEYPLVVEKDIVIDEMLSDITKDVKKDLKLSSDKDAKLLPTLRPVQNYPIHYMRLQEWLQHGFVLTGVTSILAFRQGTFMADFIKRCVENRKAAKSTVEKNTEKLLMNSVYGKHLMNKRNLRTFTLVHEEQLNGHVRNPAFEDATQLDGGMYAVSKRSVKQTLDVPLAVGVSVLEISKVLMLRAWYKLQEAYPLGDVRLLMTDTDSFIFQVFTDDWYADLRDKEELQDFRQMLDMSSYAKLPADDWRRELAVDGTANELEHLKDELCKIKKGTDEAEIKQIYEFCGLRAKMYAFSTVEDGEAVTEERKAKGLKNAWVKSNLYVEDYKACLFEGELGERCEFDTIESKQGRLFVRQCSKAGLSPYDNKMFYMHSPSMLESEDPAAFESLPYGHCDMPGYTEPVDSMPINTGGRTAAALYRRGWANALMQGA